VRKKPQNADENTFPKDATAPGKNVSVLVNQRMFVRF
jgi:hypothetical protein